MDYYGGKRGRTGSFVRALLPPDVNVTYMETHAGMLGVLLARERARVEIVNDLNSRVVNFWRCVRDDWKELKRLVKYTPRARDEALRCWDTLDEGSAVERARKFYVVLHWGVMHGDAAKLRGFVYSYTHPWKTRFVDRVEELHERMLDVVVENSPAVKLLARVADVESAVVYVDPPYRDAAGDAVYAVARYDRDETAELLLAQRGRVAVSGYNDEWDVLGWQRHEHKTHVNALDSSVKTQQVNGRVEVVWTNYTPSGGQQEALL